MKLVAENCFKELGFITENLHRYLLANLTNLSFKISFGFNLAVLPKDLFLDDPILNKINSIYPIRKFSVLRLEPDICYRWHTDRLRGSTVNMLLNNFNNSKVYFGEPRIEPGFDIQYHILEFEYKPKKLFLFNTQVPHTVINVKEPRHLFSVSFEDDLSVNFNILKKYF